MFCAMNPFQSYGLNVPTKYLFPVSTPATGTQEKRFILATHLSWIREVISEKRIPKSFPLHERLTDDEVQAYLTQGKSAPLGSQWIFVVVTAIRLPNSVKYYKALENPCNIPQPGRMSWPQIIDFIGEANFNFLWEQPQITLLSDGYTVGTTAPSNFDQDASVDPQTHLVQLPASSYLSKLLRYLYINLEESSTDDDKSATDSHFPISNLCQALSVVTVPSLLVDRNSSSPDQLQNTEGNCHFVFHPYIPHSLQDMMLFSPQKVLVSNAKQMFVIYQLLQFLRDFEAVKLPVGDLNLSDVRIDECLYVNVIPSLYEIHSNLQVNGFHSKVSKVDPRVEKIVKFVVRKVKGWDTSDPNSPSSLQNTDSSLKITPQLVELVIRYWCEGLVSNYDYLMFLNFLSGRFCIGNPNFHPVFPWVTDFTQPQGGWRDLTKSKFRLNKGERQLDIMYEEIGGNENTIAHHITDILSEITYYVYKARRTPKEVLCKFVRPKWVPAEYPSSIQRMQEWTPDECIPEFYDDPTIFQSIHDDLPDLQIPRWCANPQDFIMQHRKLLESEFVSAKLHHWIDLTFGYKLSGMAAVKSKNIYLCLVDSHEHLESHGIVQLFQTPHPPRKNILRNFKNIVHFKELKKMREMDADDTSQTSHDASSADAKTKVWKNITLPKHYDPMGFLNDFEVCMNFFRTHFPYLKKDVKITLTELKDRNKLPILVKLFGCLVLELVLPKRLRHVSIVKTVEERFEHYQSVAKSSINYVPLFCRRAVQAIFYPESLEFSIPLDISLDLLLLGDKIGPIPFPDYFADIYKMIKAMRNYERILAVAAPEDIGLKSRLQELKVKSFSRDLIQVLPALDDQGLEIVLPFVIELFQNPETRVLAVWNIFCSFSRAIGRKRSVDYLLNPILQIYEADYHSEKHLKLFHRTFILQLCSCFGLKKFLENFPTLLIEAIGGWKVPGDNEEPAPRAHLTSTDLEIDMDETFENGAEDQPTGSAENERKSKPKLKEYRRMESDQAEGAGTIPVEPEMFLMEPETSDSEDKESSTAQSTVGESSQVPASTNSSTTTTTHGCHLTTTSLAHSERGRNQSPPALQLRRSRDFQRSTSSTTGGGGSKSVADISEMCSETVLWLSHRFGPVLCAKYLTKNLLRMLTLCFLGHIDNIEIDKRNCSMHCDGDLHAKKVLECLIVTSDLYGDCFIEHQYLPYCLEVVSSAVRKLNVAIEAAILGVSAMLEHIFNHISDTFLMSQLKDPILSSILTPLCRLICSEDLAFPSGRNSVSILASKIVGMMNAIRKKIGQDLSNILLKPLVSMITTAFDKVYNVGGDLKDDFTAVFSSGLAFQLYTSLCDVISGHEHESLIRDLYLKQGLTDRSLSIKEEDSSPTSEKLGTRLRMDQQSSFGSRSFGNRIQVQEGDGGDNESVTVTKKDTSRHLRGNWLIYWDHEIGRSETKFNFKQIKLQTFIGHTAAVRCIYSLDNENSFLTASKDKTVKLFSLRNQGDENMIMNCQWTYSNHKKAVLSVLFHEPLHVAASTDGIIHIWDPFMGKLIKTLEKGSAKHSGPICCLKPIENSSTIVGAGIDSCVVAVDFRTNHSYELKIGIGQASGLVRCMAVSDNGQIVSVGHSSGMISTLDLRSGTLLGSWKGHDGEVLQLLCHKGNQLISSSFDQSIAVWNLDDNRIAFNMRGPTEPVHSLCIHGTELISCTTSNRIGVHCGVDPNSDFSSTRLRSDTFKGIVTSMRHLPLNQFLLVGSDVGNVSLLC